ncbi:hypothetical protein ACSBR2_016657 [Camellia fascicularis]
MLFMILMDMACDTFLKIVQKYKRKFVIVQIGESEPFVSELLTSLRTIIADLEPHQIHSFYESVFLVEFSMNYNIVGAFSTCRMLISELIDVEGDGMADMVFRCIQEMDINNRMMLYQHIALPAHSFKWREYYVS